MAKPKLTPLELRIMETLWEHGRLAIREIQEYFPRDERPAYTTIQTTVYRLEDKGAVRRAKKIGNAHIFEAALTRSEGRGRLINDLLDLFGGRAQPVMTHLVETGRLTLEDIREAEKLIKDAQKTGRPSKEK